MIRYTALGDSITAGRSATSPLRAYPSVVAQGLRERGRQAIGSVLAQNGWTSSALLGAMPYGLETIARSTTVSIWIGGNDLLSAAADVVRGVPVKTALGTLLPAYERNLERMVSLIRKNSNARIVLCTQYNPFPNSGLAVEAVGLLNGVTSETAQKLRTELAPVHEWFAKEQPALISGYRTGHLEDALRLFCRPIHPNDAGHALIAYIR
jgi:acyl-CoA thioesterase-1